MGVCVQRSSVQDNMCCADHDGMTTCLVDICDHSALNQQVQAAPGLQDAGAVRHDGHAVQRRLPVEEHHVAVLQVALHHVPHLHRV